MTTRSNGISQEQIEQFTAQERAKARRNRNFDRAVLIFARLNFEGVIRHDKHDLYDFHFENGVKAIVDMLERFQLDSPDGEIVDIFENLK